MLNNLVGLIDKYGINFLQGLLVTLQLSALTVFFGVILGSIICLLKMSKYKPLSLIATAYIEIIRGTPLLLQLWVFYYGISDIVPFELDKFTSVALALSFNSAGYVAEIIRAGIQAVDKGQTEAARSLGLNPSQTMLKIVFPQAIKNILPTIGNEFVMVIKETSLASTFYVGDLMTQNALIKGSTYLVAEPMLIVAAIYFVCTFSLSKLISLYERRLATSD